MTSPSNWVRSIGGAGETERGAGFPRRPPSAVHLSIYPTNRTATAFASPIFPLENNKKNAPLPEAENESTFFSARPTPYILYFQILFSSPSAVEQTQNENQAFLFSYAHVPSSENNQTQFNDEQMQNISGMGNHHLWKYSKYIYVCK